MKKLLSGSLSLVLLLLLMSSCGDVKKLQYMQGAFDTTRLATYQLPEPVIQVGDLISILVYSDNPAATALYNQPMGVNPSTTNVPEGSLSASALPSASTPGYLVDNEGNIRFQGIGTLHVQGLNKKQLTELLDSKLKIVLTNPYYNIRFLNFKVTVIGDVAHPSVFSVPAERINILEAIGLAGDLNITARRDNVLVVREENGKRSFGRLDLTKPEIFTSPFFQLQQNDVIYVDLGKNKAALNDQSTVRNITIATSILTTVAIFLNLLK